MSTAKVDFVHPSSCSVASAAPSAGQGATVGKAVGGGAGSGGGAGISTAEPDARLHRVRVMEREMGVGFSGGVSGGLAVSPSSERAFYPLGNSVVVRYLAAGATSSSSKMSFLTGGHQHRISCLHLSEETGAFLATGEEHDIGTKVRVVIWDTLSLRQLWSHRLHHARVAAVRVSPGDAFVVSAGGADDSVAPFVVWDLRAGAPLCVGKSSFGRPFAPTSLCFVPGRPDAFLAGGPDGVQIWRLERQYEEAEEDGKQVEENDIKEEEEEVKDAGIWIGPPPGAKLTSVAHVGLGKIKRNIRCMMVCEEEDGDYVVCGTDSGDIVKLLLSRSGQDQIELAVVACAIRKASSSSVRARVTNGAVDPGQKIMAAKFQGGVKCLLQLSSREYVVGSGDGSVCLVRDLVPKVTLVPTKRGRRSSAGGAPSTVHEPTKPCLKELRSATFEGSVTSVCRLDAATLLVGTTSGDVHQLDILTFNSAQLSTCHNEAIADLAFPGGLDGLLGTCGPDGVRLWSLTPSLGVGVQLLHIRQPGGTCVAFSPDGAHVLAGFEDGCVRTYTPQTGRIVACTQGVHAGAGGVSALAFLRAGAAVVTGGANGHVRAWELAVGGRSPRLVLSTTVKEHRGKVCSLQAAGDNKEFLSGSRDGFCIIWDATDLTSLRRKRILSCSSSLLSARYHPSDCQVITLSSDGRLSYWESVSGEEIRSVAVDRHRQVTAMDVDADGERIAVGANDSTAKIWRYRQGDLSAVGHAECGRITRLVFSPSGRKVVAATEHGGIVSWAAPLN